MRPRKPSSEFLARNWVLVVDDDVDCVLEITEYLTSKGFRCRAAYDGRQALDSVADTPEIALVLTDIRMPNLDGIRMAQQLADKVGHERELAVIIMTGHGGQSEAIEALQAGAVDFITKPISLKHLLHAVNKAFETLAFRHAEAEHKKALEIALQKEKNLNELRHKFVSMVSHEYRTPLAVIDGAAQSIARRLEVLEPSAILERTARIRSSVKHMVELLDDTLNFSRIDSGEIELDLSDLDLGRILKSVSAESKSHEQNHHFNLNLDELPRRIRGDDQLLNLAFSNIFSNALKYSPDADHIDVDGWEENDFAVVTVRDYGVGIPEKELPQVFDKFFRATTASDFCGTGLGLNFVKQLVELHDGNISISSEVGTGTTVLVCLPIAGPQPKDDVSGYRAI